MRCPQWTHDFEPVALRFRVTTHQTMNAIKANGTSRTKKMTSSSGKPILRIGAVYQTSANLFLELPSLEPVLVFRHFHPLAPKAHAFHFQACALLQARFDLELDPPPPPPPARPGHRPAALLQ